VVGEGGAEEKTIRESRLCMGLSRVISSKSGGIRRRTGPETRGDGKGERVKGGEKRTPLLGFSNTLSSIQTRGKKKTSGGFVTQKRKV